MRKLDKTIKFVLAVTLLLPLVYIQWTIYPSHFGKTIFFQIIVAILAVLALWQVLKEKKRTAWVFLDWLLVAFVLSSLLSSFLGIELNRSFWGDQSRVQGVFTLIHFVVFYFLLRRYIRNQNDWQQLIKVILIVSALSSVIAWIGPGTPWLRLYVPEGRLQGLIANPIFFANYLLIPAALGLAAFFYFPNNRWRYLWLAIGLLNLATIIGSRSRGALLGVVFGILVSVVLFLVFGTGKRAKASVALLIAGLATFLIIGFISPAVRTLLPNKLQYVFSISPRDATAQTRLMAWQIAYDGWKERPIFGWGPESYQDIFDHRYNPRFLKFSFAETVWDQPHNYALEILSSRGLVGLVIYLGIIILALYYLWKSLRQSQSERERIVFIILGGLVVGYVVQLLFSFETSNSWQLWFVLLAFIVWLRFKGEERGVNWRPLVKIASLCLVTALSLVSIFYGYRMLKSSYFTSYARDAALIQSTYLWQKYSSQAIEVKVPFQWEQAFFLTKDMAILDGYRKLDREALAALGPKIEAVFLKYLQKKPDTFLYKFWLGQLYAFMGEFVDKSYYAKSEKVLKETWAINKYRQTVPLLLAKTLGIEGKFDDAIEVLREVVKQDPALEQPRWFLGVNLIAQGKLSEGIAELEAGRGFGTRDSNNIQYMIDAYAQLRQYEKIPALYEMLSAREPDNFVYYANLAAIHAEIGNKAKSLENIKKAVELNPSLEAEATQFIKDHKLNE